MSHGVEHSLIKRRAIAQPSEHIEPASSAFALPLAATASEEPWIVDERPLGCKGRLILPPTAASDEPWLVDERLLRCKGKPFPPPTATHDEPRPPQWNPIFASDYGPRLPITTVSSAAAPQPSHVPLDAEFLAPSKLHVVVDKVLVSILVVL